MTSRSLQTVAIAIGASLFLSACSNEGDTSSQETVTETASSEASSPAEDTASASETSTAEDNAAASGNDPVFAAIDAVLAEHSNGIIIEIDRNDDDDDDDDHDGESGQYSVDVVVDDQITELEVGADGTVREEDRESDREDVSVAQDASVTAVEAIQQALDQNPDGIFDQASLDEDDNTLTWEVNLDDENGEDLAELNVPAN